jgi:hypothetical protein
MARRLLLVEGNDDEHVIKHFCKSHDVEIVSLKDYLDGDDRPLVRAFGGIDQLLDQVVSVLKASDLERLAIVLDADENAHSRWSQLRDRLRAAGYQEAPDAPSPEGTMVRLPVDQRTVLFGAWIMPDNRLPGMLEDFLMLLIPDDDRLLPHVDRFLDGIPATDRPFLEVARTRARIHAFLAVQKEPGKPLGLAIRFRFLNASNQAVGPFLNWLKSVLIN